MTKINITDNTMEFIQGGQSKKFTYKYVGKKILTYKKGNRGVRFLFEATDADAGQFKYVQFSDHNIAPVKAEHSISSLEAQAKKLYLKKWIIGQPTIQKTYLAKKSPKKC